MESAAKIEVLAEALRAVLGPAFEDEMRTLVENEAWYSPTMAVDELFRLHVQDQMERSSDGLWVFNWVRTSERKFLAERLGIDRGSVAGKSSIELAERILVHVGLPVVRVTGLRKVVETWSSIGEAISSGEDEKGAILCRQNSERLLRTVLFFYCSTGYAETVLGLVGEPGSLRIPRRLESILAVDRSKQVSALIEALKEDGWTDLGFLLLLVRKLAASFERAGIRHLGGGVLTLMTGTEHEAFRALSEALHPYAHDIPSAKSIKKEGLRRSVEGVRKAIESMAGRGALPDEMLVLENCETLLGPVCRGILEGGRERKLVTQSLPPLGSKILYTASAGRDYARCVWAECPWKE